MYDDQALRSEKVEVLCIVEYKLKSKAKQTYGQTPLEKAVQFPFSIFMSRVFRNKKNFSLFIWAK